jgi:hypothetical protein
LAGKIHLINLTYPNGVFPLKANKYAEKSVEIKRGLNRMKTSKPAS